jgi:hypothetical protein
MKKRQKTLLITRETLRQLDLAEVRGGAGGDDTKVTTKDDSRQCSITPVPIPDNPVPKLPPSSAPNPNPPSSR